MADPSFGAEVMENTLGASGIFDSPNDQRSSNGFDRNSTIETMLQMLKDIKDNQSELKVTSSKSVNS